VILAAWERWGESALDRFIGMFAFLIWDEREKALVGVRDRFGVKPFFYAHPGGSGLVVASEIAALQAIGIGLSPSENTWATYFKYGLHDHSGKTFWDGVESLPAGHLLRWQNGIFQTHCWYDIAERSGPDIDQRSIETISEEYEHLMQESIRLRFRSDVKLGVAISGGLDSSALVGLVRRMEGPDSEVQAYTYVCADERYDELPWVRSMLEKTSQPLVIVSLTADSIPELAAATQEHESEPLGANPLARWVVPYSSTDKGWTSNGPATTITNRLRRVPRPDRCRVRLDRATERHI
jgi:asparagine synthase (glutamine-hydrolysing)